MYVREETIEEENLDWGEDLEKIDQDTDKEMVETMHVIHPDEQNHNIHFNYNRNIKLNIKQSIMSVVDDHSEFSLLFGILFVPYLVGFVVSYLLFFMYGGMPLGSFLSINKGNFHFELWSIGAYCFISLGVIGTVLMHFKER